jgi:hypothetical protein
LTLFYIHTSILWHLFYIHPSIHPLTLVRFGMIESLLP